MASVSERIGMVVSMLLQIQQINDKKDGVIHELTRDALGTLDGIYTSVQYQNITQTEEYKEAVRKLGLQEGANLFHTLNNKGEISIDILAMLTTVVIIAAVFGVGYYLQDVPYHFFKLMASIEP